MDMSFTKHPVTVEETLFSAVVEIPVESTVNQRNTSGLKKILKTCCRPAITSKSLSEGAVNIEGTVGICLICIDDNNELFSADHFFTFNHKAEVPQGLASGKVHTEITDHNLTAAHGADGKITVTGKICVRIKVIKYKESEVICDIDDDDFEKLNSSVQATIPMGRGEKNLILEEEVAIGNGQPDVDCLLRCCAEAVVEETKIVGSKVMVKGNVRIYVLYKPCEGTRPRSFEESFPFSQLLDVENINDDCKCEGRAEVIFFELTPETSDDAVRSFNALMKICVSAWCYCDNEIPVILDAYSTKLHCMPVQEDFTFRKLKEKVNERYIVKKQIEFTDGAIGSVIDMWCDSRVDRCKFDIEGMKLSGSVTANILVFDCEGVPECHEKTIDFEYIYKPEAQLCTPDANVSVKVAHCSYTITGENTLAISAEIIISAAIYDNEKIALLSGIEEAPEGSAPDFSGSIVLYFANEGERIWDIARRYNSSVCEIKELNNITADCLESCKKIIIPTK
ncbi:MAG: DUF3794 domain-containing protein [Clostridia bacterium]|nr:DUF3794 domain-containing protein [Clostridia bacterium]